MSGTGGEFLGALPATVAIALGVSMLVAAFLVPAMCAWLIRRGLRTPEPASAHKQRKSMLDVVQQGFDWALELAFRHRAATVLLAVASVVVAGVIAATLPEGLFPKLDRNQFAVEIYLPNGRSLAETDVLAKRIETDLLADKRVVDVTAFVGTSSPRFHLAYAPNMPSRNYAQLVVNTTSIPATVEVLTEFEQRYANDVAEGYVRWKQLELTAASSPIEVRLTGDDAETVAGVSTWLQEEIRKAPGVTWTRDDHEEPLRSIEVVPDVEACARLGISPAMLRTSLALGTQGLPVATMWEGDYPIRVLIEEEDTERTTLEGVMGQQVSSMWLGASVPLAQVAKLEPGWNEGAITRRNGVRTTTVRADVGMGVLGSVVQAKVEKLVAERGPIPGVEITYGGEKEFGGTSYTSFSYALVTSVASIYLLLLIQFRRHSLALLVMATMPLSLLGAVLGLRLMGFPFGFTAFIGIISLMGIVVRNGIILVDYAQQLRAQGVDVRSAGLAAGKRRMRPIYLTTMAAAIGVSPMMFSGSTMWGPLAAVICFGLLTSMILTLFVLPVAYSLVARDRKRGPPSGTSRVAVAATAAMLVLLPAHGHAWAQEGPYTLGRCLELSRKNGSEIAQAKLEAEAAEQMRVAAFTHYLPQISAGAGVLVAKDPLAELQTSGGNLPVFDGNPMNLLTATQFAYMPSSTVGVGNKAAVMGLSAVQPLFAGGRILNGNRLAEVGVEAAQINVERLERDTQSQTEEKYWRIVSLKEKRRTLASFEGLLAELRRQVDDALAAGLVTRNDQLKVSLHQQQAAVDRNKLESGIALASRDMRRHLGLPEGDTIELADVLAKPRDPTRLRRYIAGADDRRPEIRLLEQAARAEELQTQMKLGEGLPTLSIGASAYRSWVEGMPVSGNAMVLGMVSVPLTGFVEGWFAADSQRKKAAAARLRVASTRELIGLDARKSWNELWAAWRMVAVSELTVEQAETNLTEVSDQHRNGLVPFSDLLEAQALRQQALDKQLDARSEYWLKRSAFLRAAGQGSRSTFAGGTHD